MKIEFVDPGFLKGYQDQLRALEAQIEYPIADGADFFTIDHGDDYTAFFTGLGDPRFLVAVDGDRLKGTICGILRRATQGGKTFPTVYGSDLKLAPEVRGTGLWRKMLWKGFALSMRPSFLSQWKMGYVAAMQGERGDVMRAAKGIHAAKMGKASARLAIYFIEPSRLAALDPTGAPPPPTTPGLDFSPDAGGDWVTTAGRKDLRLKSTGKPWPLLHLPQGPHAWVPTFAHYLQRTAATLVDQPGPCCFSLDQRLGDHIEWLASRGIEAGAMCTIYSFRLPGGPRPEPWVHLATSQI
ncbi:MAG: GNAT family N-acetyltransferase [Deltaproteobacteria bacterium]|nr:GNAT family N-acetyltransferase [Deltaproteobacteria bacterium]